MQHLTCLKPYLAQHCPTLQMDNVHVMVVNGKHEDGYLNYSVKLLMIDLRNMLPMQIMAILRQFLIEHGKNTDAKDLIIPIRFSSEIIDANTFDLEIEFEQRDKVVMNNGNAHICTDPVWNAVTEQFE